MNPTQTQPAPAVAHTPTPWQVATHDTNRRIVDKDWHSVCIATPKPSKPESWANAAFIVRAVNSHAALVAALQSIADSGHLESCNDTIRDRALAALALAKGGEL